MSIFEPSLAKSSSLPLQWQPTALLRFLWQHRSQLLQTSGAVLSAALEGLWMKLKLTVGLSLSRRQEQIRNMMISNYIPLRVVASVQCRSFQEKAAVTRAVSFAKAVNSLMKRFEVRCRLWLHPKTRYFRLGFQDQEQGLKSLLGVPYEIYVAAGPGGAEASGLTTVTVLYLHGGIFVEFSRNLALLAEELAQKLGRTVRVLAPSLLQAPKHLFPSALQNAHDIYRKLVEMERLDPNDILVVGDSWGGNLALGLCQMLHGGEYAGAQPLPQPCAIGAVSPFINLHSYYQNQAPEDRTAFTVPRTNPLQHFISASMLRLGTLLYLEGMADSEPETKGIWRVDNTATNQWYNQISLMDWPGAHLAKHPLVSPYYAKFNFPQMPPLMVQVSDQEELYPEISYWFGQVSKSGGPWQQEPEMLQLYCAENLFHCPSGGPCLQSQAMMKSVTELVGFLAIMHDRASQVVLV